MKSTERGRPAHTAGPALFGPALFGPALFRSGRNGDGNRSRTGPVSSPLPIT